MRRQEPRYIKGRHAGAYKAEGGRWYKAVQRQEGQVQEVCKEAEGVCRQAWHGSKGEGMAEGMAERAVCGGR